MEMGGMISVQVTYTISNILENPSHRHNMAVRFHLVAILNIVAAMGRMFLTGLFALLHAALWASELACWHIEAIIEERMSKVGREQKLSSFVENVLWYTDRSCRFAWRCIMRSICAIHTAYMTLSAGITVQAPAWVPEAMHYFYDHDQGPTSDFNLN